MSTFAFSTSYLGRLISHNLNSSAEDTLWTGTPSDYTNPDSPEALSQVRNLVDNGKYTEATEAAVNLFGNTTEVCASLTMMPYVSAL